MNLLISVGDLSTWAESVLQAYESSTTSQIKRCADAKELAAEASIAGGIPVIFIENGFGSQKWIRAVRESRTRGVLVWFGKTFSKEDYSFALQNRVYTVVESPSTTDTRLQEWVVKAQNAASSEVEMQHLLRTLKSTILQHSESEQDGELMTALKAVVGKLDKIANSNELVGSNLGTGAGESRLPLHQSAALSDALLTIADLERTGTLQITSKSLETQGTIQFLQGKIVRAQSVPVQGLKAIYRMFLWPDLSFQFTRQQATEISVESPIALSVREICVHGEKLQREHAEIRSNVPPMHLHLELEAAAINSGSRLEPDLFSVLTSVVELGKIEQVLDYNELPDVVIYKALIGLRRLRLIRVVTSVAKAA